MSSIHGVWINIGVSGLPEKKKRVKTESARCSGFAKRNGHEGETKKGRCSRKN